MMFQKKTDYFWLDKYSKFVLKNKKKIENTLRKEHKIENTENAVMKFVEEIKEANKRFEDLGDLLEEFKDILPKSSIVKTDFEEFYKTPHKDPFNRYISLRKLFKEFRSVERLIYRSIGFFGANILLSYLMEFLFKTPLSPLERIVICGSPPLLILISDYFESNRKVMKEVSKLIASYYCGKH